MTDTEFNNATEPRGKTILHSAKFVEHMQHTTGVIDANQDFDHAFLQWNLEIKYYEHVFRAYERGMIGKEEWFQGMKKPGIVPNLGSWHKMKHLWYYGLDILIQRDAEDRETIAYAPLYKPIARMKPHQIIKHLPALKKMNPVGQLKDKTLGIYIREAVPISDAWEGHDLATMVTAGNWTYEFGNGSVPQFRTPEDISNSGELTYYVSRPYWHGVIDLLEIEMAECEADVYLDNHMFIQNEVFGFMDNADYGQIQSHKKATVLV